MKQAVLIAVEHYHDPHLEQVDCAASDAAEMSAALESLGFDKSGQQVLIDSQATRVRVQSALASAIDNLQPDDTLYVFYAGHGFSQAGRNFLTCHDTDCTDWEGTSIALKPYLQKLRESPCQRIALFLDCRAGGSPAQADMPDVYGNFDPRELEPFFAGSTHCICLGACKQEQRSSSSKTLKHGIWTHHLLEALQGEAPLVLKGERLISSDLQNHLAQWVPRTIRTTYADGRQQTPWMVGGAADEFEIADLMPVLQAKAQATNSDGKLTEVSLVCERIRDVRSLKRFNRKRHKVPEHYDSTSAAWVAELANEELKEDLDRVYDDLINVFDYARADLAPAGPEAGAGSILTPSFKYTILAGLNPDDTSEAIIQRRVHEITQADVLQSPAFAEVFADMFDTLEFALPWTTKLQHIVDTIQSLKSPQWGVKFDRELTYCDLTLEGVNATIHIEGHTVSIVHRRTVTPVALIESFRKLSAGCITHNLPLLR